VIAEHDPREEEHYKRLMILCKTHQAKLFTTALATFFPSMRHLLRRLAQAKYRSPNSSDNHHKRERKAAKVKRAGISIKIKEFVDRLTT
jgi:hypothetical protein